uniref:Uncharacterized protein n=1 Tax=Curvibacter symbiont subsp. Hydra magnipapillata TaxID=667019 RepID=C9Y7N4_CURXX|nr:hypothetical protein Csp_A01350 [Curvibacter putative symbiont of Hydra magnipapillata]
MPYLFPRLLVALALWIGVGGWSASAAETAPPRHTGTR